MAKFWRSAAMMAMLAGGTAGLLGVSTTDTSAQEKGTAKKADKMEKAEKVNGRFVLSEGKDKMWRFSVYDGEKFLANSGANDFATVEEAKKGIERFKAAVKDGKIEMKGDKMEKDEKTETKKKPE